MSEAESVRRPDDAAGAGDGQKAAALLALLAAVTRAANSATSLEAAFADTLARLCAHTGWAVGHAYLTDASSGMLASTGVWYPADAAPLPDFRARTESMRFAPGVGVVGRVAHTREPAWLEDAARDPLFLRASAADGLRAGFMVPVLVGDEVVGVLECYADRAVPRDDALLEVLPHVGIQLGRAVERERARVALESRTQELSRTSAELEQFAFAASHDLQEPLRMVAIYARLLQRRYQHQLDATADRYIAYMVEGAERMSALITDVLAVTRVGTSGRAMVPTDANAALARVLPRLAERIAATGGAVEVDALPVVRADPSQLELLLTHLLDNALKFHRAEVAPRVRVAAEREGPAWHFTVRDDGIGFEPEFAELVFTLFQRLHARADYPGTGIGLTICRKIVERHGGRIWMEPVPGVGTTVHFTLPGASPAERAAPSR